MGESGKQIGVKLFALLSPHQKKELAQFVRDYEAGSVPVDLPYTTLFRGQVIPLTVKEFEIFALLILNPKRVFTYEMLLDLVWHEDYTYYSRKAINNHVSNLRKKIKIAPDLPDYVKSVYGVGYKFDI